MDYGLFISGRCRNDCGVCCFGAEPGGSQPTFDFYHVGQNEIERKGIENFLESIPNETVRLSGRDPLLNETVVQMVAEQYQGEKCITINPLTFLSLQMNTYASRITTDEAEALLNIGEDNLSQKVQTLVGYLAMFDNIKLSNGNLQGPYPELMGYANQFFDKYIRPEIDKRRGKASEDTYSYQTLDGSFEAGKLVSSEKLNCVGKVREQIESGQLRSPEIRKAKERKSKNHYCQSWYNLYFRKEEGEARLYLALCCTTSMTPYTSYKSKLTLERMAEMEPEKIKSKLEHEGSKMARKVFYMLLERPYVLERHYDIVSYPDKEARELENQFAFYIEAARELIEKRTGNQVDFLRETYVLGRDEAIPCEVCNTVGVMLHRAGISVKEWQRFLQKRLPLRKRIVARFSD